MKARFKVEKGDGKRKVDVSVSENPRKYRGVRQKRWGPSRQREGILSPHSDLVRDIRYGGGSWYHLRLSRDSSHGSQRADEFSSSPPSPFIDLKTVSSCDSGNQNLCSLIQVKKETEYQTDLEREPIDLAAEVKPTVGDHIGCSWWT
ncbi:unnamed protein product [Eruca vesicaria subsp. sativa]|uniref:Uncharacterized protein n=1 Tax=Eruca vesicaria subsp. sativa TaxID=29727 RepID=A0ABC8K223_ERUVS|nr:unnamed protein product [Eruca vesicaria subsp. sativa]